MRHHYVPKKYLSEFSVADDSAEIWMYDKKRNCWLKAAIDKVAQERGFYDPETEKQLNDLVECPGNRVLNKLREGTKLNREERIDAAAYIATMLERVPKRRSMTRALVPGVVETAITDYEEALNDFEASGVAPELAAKRRSELKEAAEAIRAAPIKGPVGEKIRSPWPSQNIFNCVHGMAWRVGHTKCDGFYLTSDNPAHFFGSLGIGRPESELTFPLSPLACVYGSWQGAHGATVHFDATSSLVRESNRRQIHGAERFVFFHEPARWFEAVARKEHPYFSRIDWGERPCLRS